LTSDLDTTEATTEANSPLENDDLNISDSSLQEIQGIQRRRATRSPVQDSRKKRKTTQEALTDSILKLASAIGIDGKESESITPLERAIQVFQEEFGDTVPYKVSRKIFDRWKENERSTITFVKAFKTFKREYINDVTTNVLGQGYPLAIQRENNRDEPPSGNNSEFPLIEDLLDED